MGWGPHGPSVYAARRIGPRRHLNDRGLYASATRSAALQHEDVHAGLLDAESTALVWEVRWPVLRPLVGCRRAHPYRRGGEGATRTSSQARWERHGVLLPQALSLARPWSRRVRRDVGRRGPSLSERAAVSSPVRSAARSPARSIAADRLRSAPTGHGHPSRRAARVRGR